MPRDLLGRSVNAIGQLKGLGVRAASDIKSRRHVATYARTRPGLADVIARVRSEKLTYLRGRHLIDLAEAVLETEAAGLEGGIIEAGTALGGSAIVLAAAKDPRRAMVVYDAFGMIPPPSEEDGVAVQERFDLIASGKSEGIGGGVYYGYHEDLLAEVAKNFTRLGYPIETNNVELVKGLYEDSMEIASPVSLAHIDCDWYNSVITCLEQIEPNLVPGGRLVIDDYDAWSGCSRAVDAYFKDRAGYTFVQKARMQIVKDS